MDRRLDEILRLLRPAPGTKLWYGGASPAGSVRGLNVEIASWKPSPDRHSIWELALHIAYWEYAVRRGLEDLASGGFPRSPADWPAVPSARSERSWREDRALLRSEHDAMADAIERFDTHRLDELTREGACYRFVDLMHGVVMHNTYHTGQIQLLKRLHGERVKFE